ncbi:MAG: hypothetical protein H6993_13445 [Pseudomonadales bacterium]|nr:hypothetical protein [Pseudomonadales bacterium]MCP5184965.1 hypothetical protein [Pseudomonadales bacterium]
MPERPTVNVTDGVLSVAHAQARRGDWNGARQGFARTLRTEVGNGYVHFLHGLACDQEEQIGVASAGCASVAYETASRLTPGNYWANLFAGFRYLREGQFAMAVARFADAAGDEDAGWEALYGLGAASYFQGDLALAEIATSRGLLWSPESLELLRLMALVHAATGEASAREEANRYGTRSPPMAARRLARRVDFLLATAAQARSQDGLEAVGTEASSPGAAPQVVIDVAIVLSSVVRNNRRGVNLLDGLRLQYGYDRSRADVRVRGGPQAGSTVTRTILSQIGVPQLDYNLNLFNDGSQYYNVLARPSLTAYLSRESSFFAGRTLTVEVAGVNLGDLKPIDVGVWLKVTPEAIDDTRTTVRIAAERSFLSSDKLGNFDQSLATFKQAVSATAELEFGQTLVLSALSEAVRDRVGSKVPVLGDVPILNLLLNRNDTLQREESLLILVTPQRPLTFDSEVSLSRAATVERLLRFWQASADPRSSIDAVLKRLGRSRLFPVAERADVPVRLPHERELAQRALDETMALLQ